MTTTKMTVTVHIDTQCTLSGNRYPGIVENAKVLGWAELALQFPGSPEEVSPIVQDILATRMEALISQALQQVKANTAARVAVLDDEQDAKLVAPLPVETK